MTYQMIWKQVKNVFVSQCFNSKLVKYFFFEIEIEINKFCLELFQKCSKTFDQKLCESYVLCNDVIDYFKQDISKNKVGV